MKKKKFKYICIFSIAFLLFIYLHHRIIVKKCSDITYAAKYYTTSGIFNSKKLYKVDSFYLKFSDTHKSILVVTGIKKKPPHESVSYELTMLKDSSGIWKIKNIKELSSQETDPNEE